MKKGKFSQEEVNKIVKLYKEEYSFKDIAQELNRDVRSISNKLKNLGIYKPTHTLKQWTKEEIDIITGMFNSGMNFTQIGNEVGRDQRCVSKKIRDLGLYNPKEKGNVSLWDVKELRKYIINEEEAKNTTYKSHNKIKVKCNTCDKIKFIAPAKMTEYGHIACPICSKGISYPELFFMSYNEVKGLGYLSQQVIDKSEGHRFDFVNYDKRVIVETHGIQHYKDKEIMDYKRTLQSDEEKRKYCKENNWTLIELDCRESSFEFIKNNIKKDSFLDSITNEEATKMLTVIEKNTQYPVKEIVALYEAGKSTTQIANIYGVGYGTILRILRKMDICIRKPGRQKKQVNNIVLTKT